jgi:hypothetical protein
LSASAGTTLHVNDPADFDTDAPYIVVTKGHAEDNRWVKDGSKLQDVPNSSQMASTNEKHHYRSVPESRKAPAVKAALEELQMCPASILQHPTAKSSLTLNPHLY